MSRRRSRLLLFCCWAAFACYLQAQGVGAGQSIWRGKSGDYAVEWSSANLKATRAGSPQLVFDAAAQAKSAWADFVSKSNGAPIHAEFTYALLSAVGSYLSLEEGVYCDCGGAHPTAVKRYRAIDLSRDAKGSPASASLTTLFPEPAVFSALMTDPIVTKARGGVGKPASLPELLDTLQDDTAKVKDCEYEFPGDLLSSFAIYDAGDGSVSVRVGLPSATQACRGEMIQLGLALPAPETFRAALAAAKERRSGLLMVDSPRSAVTSFQFSQKGKARK